MSNTEDSVLLTPPSLAVTFLCPLFYHVPQDLEEVITVEPFKAVDPTVTHFQHFGKSLKPLCVFFVLKNFTQEENIYTILTPLSSPPIFHVNYVLFPSQALF